MSANSKIEWTDRTWNPVTGCDVVSPGCKHCYAERMAKRLKAMGQKRYANGFNVTLQEDLIESPLHWKKPQRIFVNSMSDLFHEAVPFWFIEKVFATMRKAEWHTFQVLTKRHERLLTFIQDYYNYAIIPNVLLGVSVENETFARKRCGALKEVSVEGWKTFVSYEPAIG